MSTGGTPIPPDPPAPPENDPPAPGQSSRWGRVFHWSGWTKVAAMATTVATLGATNNQYSLSQQTAVTDRFRLAAEQLSSDKIDVRLSGVYLLARLGPRHHHGSHSGCGMTAATTYATQA